MAGKLILETERLLLREFDEGDVGPFYRMGTDPDVTRYTGVGALTSPEHALEIMRAYPLADYRKYGYGRWACVWRPSGEVIGFAGLKYLADLGEVDIGYRLFPEYWGRGLATEASRAALDYGFDRLGLKEIIGLVAPENLASVRVLVKLGMTFTGLMDYQGQGVARYAIQARGAPARADGIMSPGVSDP
jgi:RimJ/RimL family protein N-acetyltransferase